MNTQIATSEVHSTSEQATLATPTKKQASLITIIETVQKLKDTYRPITPEERDLIASWSGWGPYAPAFESRPKEKWQTLAPQLRVLLGREGFEAASAATPTSFFTAPYISRAIWRLAEQLGFTGGAVLEPGCGTGQVLSHAPASLDLQITGVEMEPFTASVAQLLFPQAHIINAPLQEVALQDEAFDLVVGNVPFADIDIYDRTLPFKDKLSLHNYCIYRSLAALRPGGLAILVTSRYTMDAMKSQTREILSKLGILVGAIRLPSSGHKWAKTAVITDILVFQRRYPNASWDGHDWVSQANLSLPDVTISTSAYFAKHQQQIVGTATLGRGMYGENELLIKAPEDLEGALETPIQRIVADAARNKSTYIPRIDRTKLDEVLAVQRGDGLKEGCYYLLKSVGLVEIVNGQAKKVVRNAEELAALVGVRDTALALLEAERDYSKTDEDLVPPRDSLNRVYDAYVKKYKCISRSSITKKIDEKTGKEKISRRFPPVMYQIRTDEHYPLLLGLEIYDDQTDTAQKSPIFFHRINYPAVYKETADSREEAIALSLDRYGSLDFAFMAKATSQPIETIAAYLGDLIFENPETGNWEIAPTYLSGNVRKKLEVAKMALLSDAKWQRNVDALESVQPDPIPPEDIKVLLGAPWIPINYIVQFCHETLKMKPEISRDKNTSAWHVVPPSGVRYSVEATSTWGTRRVDGFRLIEQMLNHKMTTVEDVDLEGKAHTNTAETMLAQQKRKELQERFAAWIWEENTRTKELAALYNKLYNGVVPSKFNGDHLSFAGMDAYWREHLYPWQRDFISRMINNRSALCAYPVGAGKTKIQVAGAMTLRRMKLISRAAILVPNHLLEQIASEAKQLYPSANILMISRDDLGSSNRRIFMARIATGDHDLIVMTHSAFEAINVHPDTKKGFIEERIREYKQVLLSIDQHSTNKADQRKIKDLEKQLLRMREHLRELLSTKRDPGLTFEQLGISYLIVDEAHFFKNLGLPTNQEKLTVRSSQRAQDLLMKLRWLEQHNGSRPFASFFTATPMSNSMVEAYVMLWYLNYPMLKDYELFNVDDFASMFIESEAQIEVTPNGAGFRMYERPRSFINLPEFMHLFASTVDIRAPSILADKRPDILEHTISVDPTPEVLNFVADLVARSEKIQQGDPRIIEGKLDNMLWITTDGRKAALWMGLHKEKEEFAAKLDAVATQMALVYRRWQEQAAYLPGTYKSLQIGFCDMGTPGKEKGDQVYGELKRLLVQKCVPAQSIRFIHEAESHSAKAMLFEKCRTGEVAILLGSTAKLGTGTNIQTRCAAIHHIDAPWRPDEVEQRLGRGQRPGNLYPVVEVFYYVQKRTFDAYSWQILANKAYPYNQIRSSTVISREMSYSDDSALTYGQVKAAATGDILLLEHANVSLSVDAYTRLHDSSKRARERDRQEASALRERVERLQYDLRDLKAIQDQIASYKGEHAFMTPDRLLLGKKEERRDFIAKQVMTAIEKEMPTYRVGYWQGVPIFIRINTRLETPYVLAASDPYRGVDIPCNPQWTSEDQQWRFGAKIEQFFDGLTKEIEVLTVRIGNLREQADEFALQAKTTFPHHDAWQAALQRKQALDAYIDFAAEAKGEGNKKLEKMRQELLATAPKELTERPKPKNTATVVLPPRNPAIQTETAVIAPATKADPQAVELPVPAVVEAPTPTSEEKKAAAPAQVQSKSPLMFGNPEHIQQACKRPPKATTTPQESKTAKQQPEVKATVPTQEKPVQSKSPLVFGDLTHIEQARKRPPKATTTPQEAKTAKQQPEVKAAAPAQEKKVQSKSPLVFGNPEHIQQARRHPSKATATPQEAKTAKPQPEVKAAAPAQEKLVQSKSSLMFGNPEHIQQARKRPSKASATPPGAKTVTRQSEVKAAAPTQVAKVESKSSLMFGNPEHIQQARKRRSKSQASAKPAMKKKVVYAEFPAYGVIEEEMPISKPKAVPGMPRTLWDLIEATGLAA